MDWANEEDEMDFSVILKFEDKIKIYGDGKYFKKVYSNKNDFKKDFNKLSLKLHPDKGGDVEEFKKFINVYENICKQF